MRVAAILIGVTALGCARPMGEPIETFWAKYRRGLDQGEFAHLWPATQAGCIALDLVSDTTGRIPPDFPRSMKLDTAYVIQAVPEPVAFRAVKVGGEWKSRFPGPLYWQENMPGDYAYYSVSIVLEGASSRNTVQIALDMRKEYMRGYLTAYRIDSVEGPDRWDVKAQRRPCRGLP